MDPKRAPSAGSSSSAAAPARVRPTTAAADTSSEGVKKIKDKFLVHMSAVVVSVLNNYLKPTCKQGRITSTDDFKHLAKKLTHHVLLKELRNVKKVEELLPSEPVKHKARYYVRKYMSRYGEVYGQEPLPDEAEFGGARTAGSAEPPAEDAA
ncbi:histone-lysine N-methyltransferase SETD2-like [Pollicipes pollicipes]|uniref:histone-lysine N-methyltransferase SETD2-like n=1 Tax=Pollicipes pollicipes TaxID=41117 RepID=UPI001884C2A7|nr:histone-lysine N-methyltransferase SETD2-like [Pollicipes pollicipes]